VQYYFLNIHTKNFGGRLVKFKKSALRLTCQNLALEGLDEILVCDCPTSTKVSGHQFVEGAVEAVLHHFLRILDLKSYPKVTKN
jgi:hypothetical protein